ncbi:helix-turn-helix domain-containing protein [Aidingimonas halophila]|uniref:SatD family (SatD) n=1 Tax=Aidingimonas halophila TaxID=574349 RepID=A0A1H2QCV9_9GAMM|nr:hypothetical protein [Aidingimonas halophila]GHC20901.1 hypothetical protein GCM10008094_09180 [Aidingimonas halophila]SDW04991.1 hypothetical protein SAMN05443545_10153 [Aidingimonas halophila]
MPRPIAVLTGDVIQSRKIPDSRRLFDVLDTILAQLAERYDGKGERYRGDGFQLAITQPERGLTAAIMLRAALIQHSDDAQRWDARVAIAIGRSQWSDQQPVSEANDDPFIRSGQTLDEMNAHLGLSLPAGQDNDCLVLLTRFADEMIDDWSPHSAETVLLTLQHNESQQAMAKRIGISQPGVHKRLRRARWPLLSDYLAFMEQRLTLAPVTKDGEP